MFCSSFMLICDTSRHKTARKAATQRYKYREWWITKMYKTSANNIIIDQYTYVTEIGQQDTYIN